MPLPRYATLNDGSDGLSDSSKVGCLGKLVPVFPGMQPDDRNGFVNSAGIPGTQMLVHKLKNNPTPLLGGLPKVHPYLLQPAFL